MLVSTVLTLDKFVFMYEYRAMILLVLLSFGTVDSQPGFKGPISQVEFGYMYGRLPYMSVL